jgi:hypothetical protein
VIELAERSVDEEVSPDELDTLSDAVSVLYHPASDYCACYGEEVGPFDGELVASGEAAHAVHLATSMKVNVVLGGRVEAFDSLHLVVDWTTKAAGHWKCTREGWPSEESASQVRAAQCLLLRDVVGNPFHSVYVEPARLVWNDGTLVKLAQGIYDERAFDRLPVLADALEEAGCHNADILSHCRQPGEHVRGCWVVDLLLGKK